MLLSYSVCKRPGITVSKTNPDLEPSIAAVPWTAETPPGSSTKRQAGDARRGPPLLHLRLHK